MEPRTNQAVFETSEIQDATSSLMRGSAGHCRSGFEIRFTIQIGKQAGMCRLPTEALAGQHARCRAVDCGEVGVTKVKY